MRNEDKGCTKANPVGKLVFNKLVADQVCVDIDGKVVTMASVFAQVDTLKDTVRLANVTIAQHEETIRALREGDKYTGEDIKDIISNARMDGFRDGLKEAREEIFAALNRRGIKHGFFVTPDGTETWEYGVLKARIGIKDTIELTDTAKQVQNDDLMSRANDTLLNEALISSGGSVTEVREEARCRGYITVTSCDDGSVSATADVDFPAGNEDKVASVLASLSGLLPVSNVSTGSVKNHGMFSVVPREKDE